MFLIKLIFAYIFLSKIVNGTLHIQPPNPAFDQKLYEEALNSELCKEHLNDITNNVNIYNKYRGLRIPKTITKGNMVDLGSYHACLDINENISNHIIQGKYCMIKVPLKQNIELPSSPEQPKWPNLPPFWTNITGLHNAELQTMQDHLVNIIQLYAGNTGNRKRNINDSNIVSSLSIKMGMCLPKSCTTQEAFHKLYFNLSTIGFVFEEDYCRLPDDKPWVPADTVATILLSLIGFVTILSTTYDIYHCNNKEKDPKTAIILRAFSVYTNTKRLLTFNQSPGAIQCIDGVRAFAMAWVILGHTFTLMSINGNISNLLDVATWLSSVKSLWLKSAPITVDTFFMLSGLLLVYTTAGKLTGVELLRNLHLFYLNRILRLFPLLALTVILQISVFHRVVDGPSWQSVARQVNDCRVYWWTNFLYVQNYVNCFEMCLQHTWYLTIDMHLYFISPLILYWVLSGKRQQAWISLTAGVVISFAASTIYIFVENISYNMLNGGASVKYVKYYYFNTLTRAPPFFVGMVYGYILHLGRNQRIIIPKIQVTLLWTCAAAISGTVIYSIYYHDEHYDKSGKVNCLINASIRPAWATAIGWMVLACTHGYAGPINWILSSSKLKLISRLSYSIYLIHFPIISVYAGAAVSPFYFDCLSWVYMFMSHFAVSFICGFIMTVLVDSPSSILVKFLQGGQKKSTTVKK